MKNYTTIILILFISTVGFAQNPNLGTSGAQFLQIPVGAKATALGGAYIGLADDASAVFWNPAGIAKITGSAAHFSYQRWFNMFDFNAVSFVHNLEDVGTLAASLVVFSMDKMEVTDELNPNGTGRFFDAQDMAIGLTYARKLTDRFSVGVSAKYIYQRIWNETAEGIAFDVGTQYRLDFQNLTIAMSMTNFGPEMQFDGPDLNITYDKSSGVPLNRLTPARLVTDTYPLPLNFEVGIGMDVFTTEFVKARLGIDAVHPNDNKERVHVGAEFSFFDRLFIRGGYKYNYDDEDFAFGAGTNLPFGGTRISFDYGYSLYDLLPDVHRISLGIEF
ncbi:MAG: PorV/PorQ family protein [Ignavibacteriales bacterium]|nr:PorV/PorQ family protein [Ignavibacteriales bacterium]